MNSEITIEGIDSAEESTKVEIDCGAASGGDLFTCEKRVTLKYLVFSFPATSGSGTSGSRANVASSALINANTGSVSLTIETCEFKRPGSGNNIGIHLVKVSAGSLRMTGVDCTDNTNSVSFSTTPFLVEGTTSTVTLTGLNLKKITSSASAVVKMTSDAITVTLDGCTFTECNSNGETSGALHVESGGTGSTFKIGDTDKTTFTSCTCTNGKSGGIYLKMTGIASEKQLSWGTGVKLEFSECNAAGSKITGLYLDVPVGLHENIAKAMKSSFAKNYVRGTYDWYVAVKGADGSADAVDFITEYFDPE
ncbi:uncharacterized protein MONOS_6857 [Monocercomonoides exilis]|uniref:uncharacterized protein n=1 Tax=Monocercomonoides exilis TaxID=2049356 RepID=UPI00355A5FDE|nr:hypothetical protein MONOS_6857 [Monocercomonoides exilis]|eukprot:MONOS_6857.1-p1 / transcript=MONOS_6857.1 / gene=MONOS_6857 / organism=Monocercomonoides_exilis_PA203 / gene_product=unspecified product / transcript_product=unspecified product / location=Mono_scaffold00224:48647-49570(+) / protein_length=308 / sequence_SO=supercontig / SO=protein_coding / is_pseudo=false